MTGELLSEPVQRFVATVTPALVELSKRAPEPRAEASRLERDVATEAFAIVAAVMAADRRFTDSELTEFMVAFAPWFDTLPHTSLNELRYGDTLLTHRNALQSPPPIFTLLADADVRFGTARARDYYNEIMRVVHITCALDVVPSRDELLAVDGFRSLLLAHLESVGVPRSDSSAPNGARTSRATDTETEATTAEEAAPTAPAPKVEPIEDLLKELDALVGLSAVKTEVHVLTNLIRVQKLRAERGLKVVDQSHHLVFAGNPGTGKTTVARLIARIYHSLGLISKGQFIETDRSGLIAGYVGQTAPKVKQVVTSAIGGTLFIDEAYALVSGGQEDFGAEAVATLLKLMEDHRDDLIVVIAGYTDPMETLLDSNPGLRSRFTKTITFPDYSTDELITIFRDFCSRNGYVADDGAIAGLRTILDAAPRDETFGNARLARNLFEAAVRNQATRVVALTDPTDEQLSALTAADVKQ